jgi:hypothetical protein
MARAERSTRRVGEKATATASAVTRHAMHSTAPALARHATAPALSVGQGSLESMGQGSLPAPALAQTSPWGRGQ